MCVCVCFGCVCVCECECVCVCECECVCVCVCVCVFWVCVSLCVWVGVSQVELSPVLTRVESQLTISVNVLKSFILKTSLYKYKQHRMIRNTFIQSSFVH